MKLALGGALPVGGWEGDCVPRTDGVPLVVMEGQEDTLALRLTAPDWLGESVAEGGAVALGGSLLPALCVGRSVARPLPLVHPRPVA